MGKIIAVFGASRVERDSELFKEGVLCGRLLAERGYAVATGGYGGLMEAVSIGCREAGGEVIGVTAPSVFPDRDGPNEWVTEERRADSLIERIHEMAELSAGAIALPGSLGTATELLAAWNLAFVARFSGLRPKPVIAVGRTWRQIVPDLAERLRTDGRLVTLVDDVRAAVDEIDRRLQT